GDTDGAGSLPHQSLARGDGVGSLPKPAPSTASDSAPAPNVAVLILDAQTLQPIPGALLVATNTLGDFIAIGIASFDGTSALHVPAAAQLELALPLNGVGGIELRAGDSLLILVP